MIRYFIYIYIYIYMQCYYQRDKSQVDPCEGLDDKTDRRIERRRRRANNTIKCINVM